MKTSPVFKRVDLLTVLFGVLLCDGSYICGEYRMYIADHGYGMHHFVTIVGAIQFFIAFVALYIAHKVPLHRSVSVFLVCAAVIYLTFVAYVRLFSFRSDPSNLNFW